MLADEAQVGIVTVRQLESGQNQPRRATLIVVRRTLEDAGVEFIDENGGGGEAAAIGSEPAKPRGPRSGSPGPE